MKDTILNAEVREASGKKNTKMIRQQGSIPANLYGGKKGSVSIHIPEKDVVLALNKGHFFSKVLKINHKGEEQPVLVKEIQFHPVSDRPVHLDLFRVGENTAVTIEVPVRFLNEEDSPGLKRGGALNIVRHTIEVSCPAGKIPEYIDVDLKEVNIGDSIHISSIALPQGVTSTITDRDFTIVTMAGTRADEPEVEQESEEETDSVEEEEKTEEK